MDKALRVTMLYLSAGFVWCAFMRLLFITSGAQQVLAGPALQSGKFLKAFTDSPLPRMAGNAALVWQGFFICGLFGATVFIVANSYLKGNWLKKGVVFGLLHWALMVPWFEFYLPYNVMLEPIGLVLLEGFLWLATLVLTGIYMSLIINFRIK